MKECMRRQCRVVCVTDGSTHPMMSMGDRDGATSQPRSVSLEKADGNGRKRSSSHDLRPTTHITYALGGH